MRVRVTAGVGAWIVGATTATGLSLFAVSYLSADPENPQGATLSQDQVNQALASATDTGAPGSATAPSPAATTPATSTAPTASTTAALGAAGSSAAQSPPASAGTHAAPAASAPSSQPVDRRLSGDAGTVVARCQDGMAYLETWSPAQGYQAEVLQRGPAHLAIVVFTGNGGHVTFRVGCAGGTPSLVKDDDSGIDH